jgi:endogenous inhibitor of DNA gyrase (YacG/DUF329 family)
MRSREVVSYMNATEERICPTCGHSFQAPVGGRGRPQVYCCSDCKKIEQLFSWMEDELSHAAFDPTHEKIKTIRRRIFYLSNLLNGKSNNHKKNATK